MTGRGAANFLTRVTASLAAAFFATSLLLTLLAGRPGPSSPLFETPATQPAKGQAGQPAQPAAPGAAPSQPAAPPPGGGGILEKLEKSAPAGPRVPQSK